MYIEAIDIRNFRRLHSVRLELSDETTLIVGANNSGKTSAFQALRLFLTESGSKIEVTDITASNWEIIDSIGKQWEKRADGHSEIADDEMVINNILPSVDIWLNIEEAELYRVAPIIPTLSWEGNILGIRIALSIRDIRTLYRDYTSALSRRASLIQSQKGNSSLQDRIEPKCLKDFLASSGPSQVFKFDYYTLDPAKRGSASASDWRPQDLAKSHVRLSTNPIKDLITVNEIPAFRGFEDAGRFSAEGPAADPSRLANHLTRYYKSHLNPENQPADSDYQAILSVRQAQAMFEAHFQEAFRESIEEVQGIGYPGGGNPIIRLRADIRTEDVLDHKSELNFTITSEREGLEGFDLPETHNGLGYRNLVYMIFKLISFRDQWLQHGKSRLESDSPHTTPLHLVIIEEPEAHLHVQVQQIFARKAFEVLRKRINDDPNLQHLKTQLVMSTHSSDITHELPFSCLRYFHRCEPNNDIKIPTTRIVNLKDTFGEGDKTAKFVTRYLKAHHSDLFFADGIILVEGAVERILLPNFILRPDHYPTLQASYISILEIGGSHAHRLRPLIEQLRIPTLVITDIDAKSGKRKVRPELGKGHKTGNHTLKEGWAGFDPKIDNLFTLDYKQKVLYPADAGIPQVRFAYQTPISFEDPNNALIYDVYPSTFEDALALENAEFFRATSELGLISKFRKALSKSQASDSPNTKNIPQLLFNALKDADKAGFALEVLWLEEFSNLKVPQYIHEGLEWLQDRLSGAPFESEAAAKILTGGEADDPAED